MVRELPLRNRTQRKVKPLHKAGTQPAIPVGLGMALVHNQQALAKFSALTDEEKRAFIAGGGDASRELEVLESVKPEDVEKATFTLYSLSASLSLSRPSSK